MFLNSWLSLFTIEMHFCPTPESRMHRTENNAYIFSGEIFNDRIAPRELAFWGVAMHGFLIVVSPVEMHHP